MATQTKKLLTEQEYLALEREAKHKSEYLDGEVFAMAGASSRHVAIVTNLVAELHAALKGGPCRVFASDLRLRITPTGLYTYPDVMVACGELQFSDAHKDTLLNPVLVVEVLSKSTQSYDRGDKFAHYRTIPSILDYALIAQDRCHVEYFWRQPGGAWTLDEYDQIDGAIHLRSIDCELQLADVYYGIDFPSAGRLRLV